jgi:hypothetical protein
MVQLQTIMGREITKRMVQMRYLTSHSLLVVVCTWIIEPEESAAYLTLEFTKFSVELGWGTQVMCKA